jgi:hypothetical protein
MEPKHHHWAEWTWFEVEREEAAAASYPLVYILRPASPGKILRGYEEYDTDSAVASKTAQRK